MGWCSAPRGQDDQGLMSVDPGPPQPLERVNLQSPTITDPPSMRCQLPWLLPSILTGRQSWLVRCKGSVNLSLKGSWTEVDVKDDAVKLGRSVTSGEVVLSGEGSNIGARISAGIEDTTKELSFKFLCSISPTSLTLLIGPDHPIFVSTLGGPTLPF